MKVTQHSHCKLKQSAKNWEVEKEYFDPIYNYLVHGYSPGGFFTAVLAGDWFGAIQRSHPGNNIQSLKNVSGWITECVPAIAYNSYKNVEAWCEMTDDQRRPWLEAAGLIYNEKEEVQMALRGTEVIEPVLF